MGVCDWVFWLLAFGFWHFKPDCPVLAISKSQKPKSFLANNSTNSDICNPSFVLFIVGIQNAFNSLLRKTIFQEIRQYFPHILPRVNCLYENFRKLWTKSIDGTFMSINSEEGVKQGETPGISYFLISRFMQVYSKDFTRF